MSTSGGATWTDIDKAMGDGYALAYGSILEAGCLADESTGSVRMAVCRTTNNGKTWSRVMLSTENGYVKTLAVHPKNKKILLAGGRITKGMDSYSKLYKSTDGGFKWVEITSLSQNSSCVNAISFDPSDSKRVLLGMKDGIWKSTDEGTTWIAPGQQIVATSIVADPLTRGRFFAGSSEGVWMSVDGGQSWKELNDGLSCRSVLCIEFDPVNAILYAGTERGGVVRLNLSNKKKPI